MNIGRGLPRNAIGKIQKGVHEHWPDYLSIAA